MPRCEGGYDYDHDQDWRDRLQRCDERRAQQTDVREVRDEKPQGDTDDQSDHDAQDKAVGSPFVPYALYVHNFGSSCTSITIAGQIVLFNR